MTLKTGGVILLAEDNPDDGLLVRRAFKNLAIQERLIILGDGHEVVDYLEGSGPYGNRTKFPLPKLLLLDLEMPRVSGFQVLDWIRRNANVRQLPVIVLTSSVYSQDVTRAYQLGANSFLIKPTDLAEFTVALKEMAAFWLTRCELPSDSHDATLEGKIIEFPALRTGTGPKP